MGAERYREEKAVGERPMRYSWVSQRKVAPGFWKPKCVTASEGGPRRSGERRTGLLESIAWEAVPARSRLRPLDH